VLFIQDIALLLNYLLFVFALMFVILFPWNRNGRKDTFMRIIPKF